MGVLEDAIREHLELKRKHGASDEEVEAEELEALGPARRAFEAPADETADEVDHADEAAHAEQPEHAGPEPPEPEASEPGLPEPEAAEPEPEPDPEPLAHEPPPEPLPEPEAVTRMHESPIPDPALTDPQGPDFLEDEEREQASESKPRRDFDFD